MPIEPPVDIQTQILEEVVKLSKKHADGDAQRDKLSREVSSLKNHITSLHEENSIQTRQLENLMGTLDSHVSDLDGFKTETSNMLTNLSDNIDQVTLDLVKHMDEEVREQAKLRQEISAKIDYLMSGFPEDSTTKKPMLIEHKADHEVTWGARLRWDRRKEKAYEHMFVGSVWALAIFVAMAVWEAIKAKVGS